MQVVKRDGTLEVVKIEKILHAVNRACRGLERVESIDVAKRTISGLHQGSTTEELDELSIQNAVMLMAEEPNYSKVAARMLSEGVRKEVGRDLAFRQYLEQSVELGLLGSQVAELATQDIQTIEFAIRHERDDLFEYFGLKTVADRYLLRHPQTRKIIERPQWMLMRVALGLSNTVSEAIEFYDIISQFLYMPATPTLFNSGTRHQQMSSCYLLSVADDSLEGIYKSITDSARLSKFSGGIGIDWTPVRASGALIRGTNGLSNGIIPFLKVFDSSVHAVNQGGKRKGAAAVYLEPWHADIEAFLELRNNTGAEERRTHHLNLALWVSDLFMKRVETDQEWSLFSPSDAPDLVTTFGKAFEAAYTGYEAAGKAMKKVSARQLYARMCQTLAETGNGWICFKDHANERCAQTGAPGRVVRSSNLCTEIIEIANAEETAVCNLGSINLAMYVRADGSFDWHKLGQVTETAMKYLDRVVDRNFYPTSESKHSNHKWRPVGLGIMGLQDALFKMRIPFSSEEAKKVSARISETVYYHAIQTSMKLADVHGPFSEFKNSRYAQGKLQPQLARDVGQARMPETHYDWEALAREVQKRGLRNSLMIAIAPTATIASIVGSYESIEPQISNIFKRETLSGEFLQVNRYLIKDLQARNLWNDEMRERIVAAEGSIQTIEEIPADLRELYKTTWEHSQKDLIEMAVDRSTFVCQSQSLNLFMEAPSVGKLSSMYMYAWKQGVKTTYYLRSRAATKIQKVTGGGGSKPKAGPDAPAGAESAGSGQMAFGGLASAVEAVAPTKTYTAEEAVVCSLENPESCEACQ